VRNYPAIRSLLPWREPVPHTSTGALVREIKALNYQNTDCRLTNKDDEFQLSH
jgi:hypothetical protein